MATRSPLMMNTKVSASAVLQEVIAHGPAEAVLSVSVNDDPHLSSGVQVEHRLPPALSSVILRQTAPGAEARMR